MTWTSSAVIGWFQPNTVGSRSLILTVLHLQSESENKIFSDTAVNLFSTDESTRRVSALRLSATQRRRRNKLLLENHLSLHNSELERMFYYLSFLRFICERLSACQTQFHLRCWFILTFYQSTGKYIDFTLLSWDESLYDLRHEHRYIMTWL